MMTPSLHENFFRWPPFYPKIIDMSPPPASKKKYIYMYDGAQTNDKNRKKRHLMPDLFSSIALRRSLPARRLKKQNTLNATTVFTLLKTSFLAKQYTALGTLLYSHHFHDSGEIDVILSSWVLMASNRRLVIQFLAPHFS